jgi:cell division septation protein DedD
MLRTNDRESEILLGNKQLLGIFFAVALLLGVAFYGGYMVGRNSSGRKTEAAPETAAAAPSTNETGSAAGETHTIPGESAGSSEEGQSPATREPVTKSNAGSHELAGKASGETPLGSHKTKTAREPKVAAVPPDSEAPAGTYQPQPGSEYLQVVALGRSEAEGLADVLHKKGFRAHVVPKPGNASLYRVIVGPIRDAGDLSSTRDALRKTGFREVIVQHY